MAVAGHHRGAKEDVLTTFMRRFVAPRRAVMSPGSPAPVFAGGAGSAALLGTGTVVAAGGPVGGGAVTVPHGVVVRRGCFPAGAGMVLLEGWVGIVHAPARGVPVICLLAGWNLGRGNNGVWG
jgi:hypothetical protein